MDSSSLEEFKNCMDVVLRDVVSGHGGDALTVGLEILEVFSNHNESLILFLHTCCISSFFSFA